MVLDTRKTTPGMRWLEKYAVRCGGGTNKRMGLYDVAMIKDNHKLAAGSVAAAYALVRERFPDVDVQVEVTTPAEAQEAYDAGARFIMCDNMSVDVLRETVDLLRAAGEPVEIEATGGLTLEVVAELRRDRGRLRVGRRPDAQLTHRRHRPRPRRLTRREATTCRPRPPSRGHVWPPVTVERPPVAGDWNGHSTAAKRPIVASRRLVTG